jgi:hypothetical protein
MSEYKDQQKLFADKENTLWRGSLGKLAVSELVTTLPNPNFITMFTRHYPDTVP